MLGSVKIYGKKEVTLPKKRSKYQNKFMKSNSPGGFCIFVCGHLVLAPRLGYLARMDLKKIMYFKSIPTGSAALIVCFLGVSDPKPNLKIIFRVY